MTDRGYILDLVPTGGDAHAAALGGDSTLFRVRLVPVDEGPPVARVLAE